MEFGFFIFFRMFYLLGHFALHPEQQHADDVFLLGGGQRRRIAAQFFFVFFFRHRQFLSPTSLW